MSLSHALQRSVSNTTDTAVHVLCVLFFLPNNLTIIIRVAKMCRQPALSPATVGFLPPKIIEKKRKNGRLKKLLKKKEKEIVLIMIYMFFFVKHLIYLGNTYPL